MKTLKTYNNLTLTDTINGVSTIINANFIISQRAVMLKKISLVAALNFSAGVPTAKLAIHRGTLGVSSDTTLSRPVQISSGNFGDTIAFDNNKVEDLNIFIPGGGAISITTQCFHQITSLTGQGTLDIQHDVTLEFEEIIEQPRTSKR